MNPVQLLYKYLDSLSVEERKLAISSLSSKEQKMLAKIHKAVKGKK